jgi:hypothetical protein
MSTSLATVEIRRAPKSETGAPALGLVGVSPPALRARQLFKEARAVSLDHLHDLDAALASVSDLLEAIVEGGDLYAPGLREFARKLAEDLSWKNKTLRMLSERQAAGQA